MSARIGNNITSEKFWGGILPAPATPAESQKLVRVQSGQEELTKLLRHWYTLSPEERPRLNGLSAIKTERSGHCLQLLLDRGPGAVPLVLEVYQSGAFPRPSALWPYCRWWEEELRIFGDVLFADSVPTGGAQWLQG